MSNTAHGHPTGGDLLVQLLREHEVDVAFGVVSIHNLPLVESLDRELTFVPVRHEAAAVNAADGYARSTGKFGVAITSTGTGAGNAAGSMLEALSAGSRVLHITGQIESEFLGTGRGVIHEVPRQLQMLGAISRFAALVPRAQDARRVLEAAIADMLTAPYAPASVEWPIDLQYLARTDDQVPGIAAASTPVVPRADPMLISQAVRMLSEARQPLIWAGGGARHAGRGLVRLVDRLGAGLLTSNAGRGAMPEDHDLVIGNFGSASALTPLLDDADVLLSIGTHFRSNETRSYALELPEQHIQINLDPAAIGRVYPATLAITSDAASAVDELAARVVPLSNDDWRHQVSTARADVRREMSESLGAYRSICSAMRTLLPRDSVIARDVTIASSSWGNRLLEIYRPESNVFPVGGGIGQGLAMGIGAAVGNPSLPTVVMVGDGGLSVHLGELATLADESPWCVVIVFNDGGYGVLRNLQESTVGRRSGVDLFTPNFGLLAGSLDIPHALARSAEEFAVEFKRLLQLRRPALLEVDVAALQPQPRPFVPPVHVPGSFKR